MKKIIFAEFVETWDAGCISRSKVWECKLCKGPIPRRDISGKYMILHLAIVHGAEFQLIDQSKTTFESGSTFAMTADQTLNTVYDKFYTSTVKKLPEIKKRNSG